jgi:glycerophosphoryl diester phosphodiesterase
VSAHRGRSNSVMPENAIVSFQNTLVTVPAFLEVDLALTRDGALVLMHDDTVDRTTDGHGTVSDLTLAEFQAFGLRGPIPASHPPSLREALDWAAGKTVLELDIKPNIRFEEVIDEVRAANAVGRVVFITYSVGAAARLARLAPEAMMYVTITSARDLDELERRGVDLGHVVAWTGDGEPNSALNVALAQRGVEVRFGMFGDNAVAEQSAAFAEAGLQIIASDRAVVAVRDLDENDGVEGYGALQCVAAD